MDCIFDTSINHKQIIYTIGNHIIVRQLWRDHISAPMHIAKDYASNLCSALFDNDIYYSYITLPGALVCKELSTKQIVFCLNANSPDHYADCYLNIFFGHIVIVYSVYNSDNDTWRVEYYGNSLHHTNSSLHNYQNETKIPSANKIICTTSCKPELSVLNTGTHLIINIQSNNNNSLWELSSDYRLISHDEISGELKKQSIWQLDKINSLQDDVDKLRQAGSLMMNKISSLLDENDNINKALTIREAQIESAKRQYNELMDIAQKYKDEAVMWRSKHNLN